MKQIILFVFCLLSFNGLYAQVTVSEELEARLNGKTKFYEIKRIVDNYYRDKISLLNPTELIQKKQLERETKKWNRSFYENETHLNANSEVENASQRVFDFANSSDNQTNSFTQASIGGSWTLIGPTNVSGGVGRINRLAYHPSNSQILYAGSAGGGLFKTTTHGAAWSNVGSYLPSLGVSGIVVSHNNGNEVYVLTGDGDAFNGGGFTYSYGYIRYSVGILKSTDGGQSFQQTGDLPGSTGTNYVGFNLVQDPNNASVLIATTNRGIYRTSDGGTTWTRSDFTNISDQRRVYDIEYKPGSSTIVYCTARDDNGDCQFYKSTDGGVSFVQKTINFMADANRIEIAVTPANSAYVYILAGPGFYTTGNNSNDSFKGLFRSTDSGDNFSKRSDSPDILGYDDILNTFGHQSDYDLALAVSPTNANTVVAGGLVVWRSTNGGVDWSEVVDYFEDIDNSNYIHADVHHLIYNPSNSNLYASTDGGVSVSTDHGDNWSHLFNGLSCTQFYHFEAANEDGNIWGGTQDNGTMIRSSGSVFSDFDGGDGYDVLTDHSPAGNNDDSYWVINKEIWTDGVVDINITPPGINEFFPNLGMSPTNEDIIYAGYSRLFVSYNRGSDWSDLVGTGYFVPGNWSLGICPTNRRRIYSAGFNNDVSGLFRVDNLDDVAADVITNLTTALETAGYPNNHPKITDIAVSPNGSNVVWVTVSGYVDGQKVYYSTNAGGTWTNISAGLPNLPVHTIVADANDNIYIGTDIGVYYRGSGNSAWTPFYNGLPRVGVSELEIAFDPGQGELRLYASTYGRGIWISDVFGACPTSLNLTTSPLQGQRFYQAGTSFTSTSVISGAAGTNIGFRAGTEVFLTPGFNAIPGTEFRAYIGPCNSGLPFFRTAFAENDSVIVIQNKINDYRLYGNIDAVTASNKTVTVNVDLKQAGDFAIKIYDASLNKYILTQRITASSSGRRSVNISLPGITKSFLRADLYRNDDLIFIQDFENK